MISLMRRTEEEITGSDENIAGNVFIGAGETETVRLFAQVAKKLQQRYPDIGITSPAAMRSMYWNIWIKD